MKKLPLVLLIITALSSSCTWVKLTEQGRQVAVANTANIRSCEDLRELTVSVTYKVGFITRNPKKVAAELTSLARNEAATFAADTIVASTAVKDGRQSFNAYKCNAK